MKAGETAEGGLWAVVRPRAIAYRPRLIETAAPAATWLVWSVAGALLAGYFVVYLGHAWALLNYPFAIDQGEGYDAYSGWLVHLGQWIYTDNALFPHYSSNYPPLYSYLISIPMAWLGPSLASARLVSVLSTLGVGALIAWLIWRETRHPIAPLIAALLFFASNYVFHATPLARVNATTLFFAVAALALLERSQGWRVIWPAGVLLAAMLTKQSAVDALAAGALWLLLNRRPRELLVLGGVTGAGGLVAAAALEWFSGGHFWSNVVLGNVNPWDSAQALAYYGNFLELHVVIVALAVLQTGRELRAGKPSLFGCYLGTAALLAIGAGKWGAGESYFLPVLAAACVQAGKLLAVLFKVQVSRPLLGAVVLVQAVLVAHGPLAAFVPGIEDRGFQARELGWTPGGSERAAGQALADYAGHLGGPLLAEDPGFSMAAGKPVVGNATHLRNLWQAGLWDETNLVRDLAERRYDMVFLDAQLYPPPVLEAVGRYYYLYDQVHIRHRQHLVFAPGSED